MPYSIKGDNELLKNKEIRKGNLFNAILLRRSEKAILKSVLKMAKVNLVDVKRDWDYRGYDIPTIKYPNDQ